MNKFKSGDKVILTKKVSTASSCLIVGTNETFSERIYLEDKETGTITGVLMKKYFVLLDNHLGLNGKKMEVCLLEEHLDFEPIYYSPLSRALR